MNLEKLDADERNLCLGVGEDLTGICYSFDFSKKMSINLPRLSPEDRRRLLDKMVFYKIFYVDSYCQRQLDATRYKFLLVRMEKVFRERLSASNLNTLEYKLSACSKIPFDEFTALRLTERAGFGAENFFDEIYTNFKLELMVELADLQVTIEKTAEFLNAPPAEQEAFLRRIEKNMHARKFRGAKFFGSW